MKLQYPLILLGFCCAFSLARVRPLQGSLLEWINSILSPPTTTTATIPVEVTTTPSTTTTRRIQPLPPNTTSTTRAPIEEVPLERDCTTCRCGLINTLQKIVGGQETRIHQYPWMTVILINNRFYCSGSLINDLYVLTAAHCVEGVPAEFIALRFLEHNRSQTNEDMVIRRSVAKVKVHELYNPLTFDNDIALMRLHKPVDVENPFLRPICLPIVFQSFDHEVGVVTGWGAQREAGYASDTLREVDVLVITQSDCRNHTSYRAGQITDNMMCAGYISEGGKDACGGDSGGPLQTTFDERPGQYQLAGLVSWGAGCARPQSPGVYTRVNRYLRWLESNTPGACYCMPYPEEDY
ncbi:hypothetical protein KR018_009584 [Drosophila ironensis]|nr:hypothetical protein KR018_009584 [Drosophila ironensis]